MDELIPQPFPGMGSKALFKALAKWQSEHSVVKKDADGRFKYASLEVVTHFVSSATAYGLSHYYRCSAAVPEYEGGPSRTEVTAFLVHEDGGFAHSSLVIDDYNPKNGQDRNQQRGSSLTYARRYLLGLLYGIATGDKDLDAEEPSKPQLQQPARVEKVISPTQSKTGAVSVTPESNLISPNHKEGIVVRVAPMDTEEREALMLEFKQVFKIRCNETRNNPKGVPSRDHITTTEHGEWFDKQLAARAERLKQELKETQ